jgi:hypothetical protein
MLGAYTLLWRIPMATLPVTVLKMAWKVFGPTVTTLCIKLAEGGVESLRDVFRKKQLARQTQAQRKADEAEARAKLASKPADAIRYESEARIWREVAQQYAADKEALMAEIERLKRQVRERSGEAAGPMPTVLALPAPEHENAKAKRPDGSKR